MISFISITFVIPTYQRLKHVCLHILYTTHIIIYFAIQRNASLCDKTRDGIDSNAFELFEIY